MQHARRNREACDAGWQNYFLRGKFENGSDLKTWKDHQRSEIGINLFNESTSVWLVRSSDARVLYAFTI